MLSSAIRLLVYVVLSLASQKFKVCVAFFFCRISGVGPRLTETRRNIGPNDDINPEKEEKRSESRDRWATDGRRGSRKSGQARVEKRLLTKPLPRNNTNDVILPKDLVSSPFLSFTAFLRQKIGLMYQQSRPEGALL
jgi:hypothetical protein